MRSVIRTSAFVSVAVLSMAIFFRVSLISHFTALWGNDLDGGIEAAILEHWNNVLHGTEDWNRTSYFYPHADTLGYDDGYLLYGLMDAVVRSFGANVFAAPALVDMSVKVIGFAAMFVFLRRVAECRFGFALFGSTLFTLAHNSFVSYPHEQLLSVAFAPLLGWLIWEAWRALSSGRPGRFVLWGGAAGLLWGAWLLTAYYMAWFTTIFACVLAVVAAAMGGPAGLAAASSLAWRWRWPCAFVAAVTVLAMIPFLIVYLPKLSETGGQRWSQTLAYIPKPNDIVNLGPNSLLWGRFYRELCPFCLRNWFELETGITPILLLLFISGTVLEWMSARRPGFVGTGRPLILATAAAVVVLCLAMFRWGHVTPWWLVWKLVPGAGGVRVVSRLEIFLVAPIIVVAVSCLQRLYARMPRYIVVLLGGLILLEQGEPAPPMYVQPAELARLSVPLPPAACRVFYVSATRSSELAGDVFHLYPHNVEAMVISELIGLPTINGHATFDPPDWNFAEPLHPDYEARVRAYAARYNLAGLCRLDLLARSWTAPAAASADPRAGGRSGTD